MIFVTLYFYIKRCCGHFSGMTPGGRGVRSSATMLRGRSMKGVKWGSEVRARIRMAVVVHNPDSI